MSTPITTTPPEKLSAFSRVVPSPSNLHNTSAKPSDSPMYQKACLTLQEIKTISVDAVTPEDLCLVSRLEKLALSVIRTLENPPGCPTIPQKDSPIQPDRLNTYQLEISFLLSQLQSHKNTPPSEPTTMSPESIQEEITQLPPPTKKKVPPYRHAEAMRSFVAQEVKRPDDLLFFLHPTKIKSPKFSRIA